MNITLGVGHEKVSVGRRNIMRSVRGKGNKSTELKFCDALREAGILGWKIQAQLVGRPDVYFPWYNVVIFLDGCFWHNCSKCGHIPKTNQDYWKVKLLANKDRDRRHEDALRSQGYAVLRFWEHDLFDDIDKCIDEVKEAIELSLEKIRLYS